MCSDGGILSQCTHTSNYHDVHFQHLTILFVNYVSIKVKYEKDLSLNMKKELNIFWCLIGVGEVMEQDRNN